jgi:hypothetical protein
MGSIHTVERGSAFAGYTQMEVTVCTCGVLFAMPERMLRQRREDGKSFFCPHGHSLSFHETELDRLRNQARWARDAEARAKAARDQAQADARAQKAAKTRFKNERDRIARRSAAGVCPCCNRTFKQLRRHMASQHPDFAEGLHG